MLPKSYPRYLGRFAPSPTGPLHYGSLVTAVASYLQAKSQNGNWLIRIENIDPPREQAGAIFSILQTLSDYGFQTDNKPLFQKKNFNKYLYHAQRLTELNHAYACECSRKDLALISSHGNMGAIYPGTCAHKNLNPSREFNIRVLSHHSEIKFIDSVYGEQNINLSRQSGDYVILRRDYLPSYILAVSIDDADEGYTEVVRGYDLLAITPRQIHLTNLLGRTAPAFMHIPIITNDQGEKLSKQTYAPALSKFHARTMLYNALIDLGQEPPKYLQWQSLMSIWTWAILHWQPKLIPAVPSIPYRL